MTFSEQLQTDEQIKSIESKEDSVDKTAEAQARLGLTMESCARHENHANDVCKQITQQEIPDEVTNPVDVAEDQALNTQLEATQKKLEAPDRVLKKYVNAEAEAAPLESSHKIKQADTNMASAGEDVIEGIAGAAGAYASKPLEGGVST